jgi:hypothetical protein
VSSYVRVHHIQRVNRSLSAYRVGVNALCVLEGVCADAQCTSMHVCVNRWIGKCFNTPCQFTPLLNLRSLVFGLRPFGWLHSITLTSLFSDRSIIFYAHIFRNTTQQGRKTGS